MEQKKRGRPRKTADVKDVQQQITEIIKEIIVERIVEVPEPRLEGFELYKALKEKGFYQGGQGRFMEDPNGIETVYIPLPDEIYTYFIGDPSKWEQFTDAMIRAYIELQ